MSECQYAAYFNEFCRFKYLIAVSILQAIFTFGSLRGMITTKTGREMVGVAEEMEEKRKKRSGCVSE